MTVIEAFESAKQFHEAGDLPAARQLYDRVLAEDPMHASAIFRIGVLEMQAGRLTDALAWFTRAIAIAPDDPRYRLASGQVLSRLRRFNEAAGAYHKVLALQPGSSEVHFALGLALHSQNKYAGAIAAYQDALSMKPDFTAALTNLGAAMQSLGRHDDAIDSFKSAVMYEPSVALHYVNLGAAFCGARNFADAVNVLTRAVELNPASPEAAYNLGNALAGQGKLQEASAAYRNAVALNPAYTDALINLGNVCKKLGEYQNAAAAFDLAMRAQPPVLAAYNNAGCLLRSLGKMDEAETVFRKALAFGLNSAAIYDNLGSVLKDSGDLDEGIEFYRKAITLDPGNAGIHGNLIYSLSFQFADGQPLLEECRRWEARHALPLRRTIRRYDNDPSFDRRLRIGYVSGDFRDHCQSLFTIPLLSKHDHKNFEIFCYSSVERPDDYTRRAAGYADAWRDVGMLDDAALSQRIGADRIDILVDLGMHMATGRPLVFARAPAPVQTAWLAYPGTTGMSAINYRLTDPRLDPPSFDIQYAEESVRLPDTFWCYDPLADVPVNPLPSIARGLVTFGCLNNPCKLTDQTFAIWTGVIRALPNSRLLLMAPSGRPQKRLLTRLAAHGIAADRVAFAPFRPRSEYLRTYHEVDLGLDTFPYNGHTTSLDSFWMGVPVVTRVGRTAVGRAGLSQLFNLGLLNLAAESDEDFVRIAVNLAADRQKLAELRQALRPRMERSPLMDAARFARNIEAAYRQMWQAWCKSRIEI